MNNLTKALVVVGSLGAVLALDRFVLGGSVEIDAEVELPIPLGLFFSKGERYRAEIATEGPLMLRWALKGPTGVEIEHGREVAPQSGHRSLVFKAETAGAHTLELELGKRDFDEPILSRRARVVVRRGDYRIISPFFDRLR